MLFQNQSMGIGKQQQQQQNPHRFPILHASIVIIIWLQLVMSNLTNNLGFVNDLNGTWLHT